VQRERQGKFMRYQLADERVAALLALADEVLSDHFDQLAACARYDSGEERA
jgi:hypothetical protein